MTVYNIKKDRNSWRLEECRSDGVRVDHGAHDSFNCAKAFRTTLELRALHPNRNISHALTRDQ